MTRWYRLAGTVLMATGLALGGRTGSAGEPVAVLGPDDPGPFIPPAGISLFDELFATEDGHAVPYPFERLLDALNTRIAPATVVTALIPIGRSLQRYAAHPDYFGSPRVVVAIDGEPSARHEPFLKDRLFLGFQPAAGAIEIISYNETAGRFEFQEIVDYGARPSTDVRYASRDICVPCHQGHAPIFSRPLWEESNANPRIAAELSTLGSAFHGAAVRQGVDRLDDFDLATDRANRIAVVNRLWNEGCGEGPAGANCRAALLGGALRYRLSGARAAWRPDPTAAVEAVHDRLTALWPDGLGTPSPDLPNRNPLLELAAAGSPDKILDTDGVMNPETPRPMVLQWSPGAEPAGTFAGVARAVAGVFAASDIAWLDRRLAAAAVVDTVDHNATCRLEEVQLSDARSETRFDCGEAADGLRLTGFVVARGPVVEGGRVDTISIGQGQETRRLLIAGGSLAVERRPETFRLELREAGAELQPRLVSGERVTAFSLRRYGRQGVAEITTTDDLDGLDRALERLAADGSDALGPGPLRRRAVLAALDAVLPAPGMEE